MADGASAQRQSGRVRLVRRAIDRVKQDCRLAGFDVPSYTPKLSAVFGGGRRLVQSEVTSWSPSDETLGKVVKGMVARHLDEEPPKGGLALRAAP